MFARLLKKYSDQIVQYSAVSAVICSLIYVIYKIRPVYEVFLSGILSHYFIGGGVFFLILLSTLYFNKKKKGYIPIVLYIVLVSAMSGKIGALLIATVFLASSCFLGYILLQVLFSKEDSSVVGFGIVSLMVGLLVNSVVIFIMMHFVINNSITYVLFIAIEISICFLIMKKKDINLKTAVPDFHSVSPGQAIVFSFCAFFFVYALVPFYLWDDVVRHLYVPNQVLLFGYYTFDPSFAPALDSSIIPQSSYVLTYVLGGEYAVRIVNYTLMMTGFLAVENFCRKNFGERVSVLSALLLPTVPILLWMTGISFIDSFNFISSFALLIIVFRMIQNEISTSDVFLFFIGLSFVYLSKQQGVFVMVPCCVIFTVLILMNVFTERRSELVKFSVIAAMIPVFLIGGVLLHNYIISGNPLFPYYNGIFKSPYFSPENFLDTRWNLPLNLYTIKNMTFQGTKYVENCPYSLGFSFFVFFLPLPFLFYRSNRKRFIGVIFFLLAAEIILWKITTGLYMRYAITIFPVAVILISCMIDKIISLRKNVIIKISMFSVIVVVVAANFISLLNLYNFHTSYPFYEALTGDYSSSVVREGLNARKVYDYAAEKYGKNSKGFIMDDKFYYFAKSDITSNFWYFYKDSSATVKLKNNPEALINYIFSTCDYLIINTNDTLVFSKEQIAKFFINECAGGGVALVKPKFQFAAIIDKQFDPAIVVTEKNPKSFQFDCTGKKYRIEIECKSDGKSGAMSRFQINWFDIKGSFIATYIKPFETTSERKKYVSEDIQNIPKGAVWADFYVTGHTQDPVKVYSCKLYADTIKVK